MKDDRSKGERKVDAANRGQSHVHVRRVLAQGGW